MPESGGKSEARVWDVGVRAFHWLLVAAVVTSAVTGLQGAMDWHVWSGHVVLGLLIFRLIWGLVGGETARFAQFVRGPASVARYARSLASGAPEPHVGHNPLGALMIVALLAFLAYQVGTGMFANDDIFTEGPLAKYVSKETSDWLTGLHHLGFNIGATLVGLHVAAAVGYLLFFRENLIEPMITGRGFIPGRGAPPALPGPVRLIGAAAVAAAAVWAFVEFL